ncbi:hypothetical protein J3L11_05965 [Shewanella sp. 4t3-1-2LB]|uniref:virulence factor TspB C-terminal domain-related protein n=1 Tax=Shewanella sp. 4t3-1-2LB TaxID=2817682 RepID=UPI001A9906B8|nr:virulence factor TspB C-terminal domain-related protein [Shewanella sp. 4t3-1-2LB]MBO1271195.1 hypothetical protein [Shewanella sp. 4t3-1-2LB]
MDFGAVSANRLCKAAFLLGLLSPVFPSFAEYTPPATPGVKVTFQFNDVEASKAFYASKCDSNNYSWHGMDNGWFCAVGDPTNIVCIVDMTYDATDVNNCQNSGGNGDNGDGGDSGGGDSGGGDGSNTYPDPYFSPEAEFYGAKSLYEGLKHIQTTNSIYLPEIRSEIIKGSGSIVSAITALKNAVTSNGISILATNNRLDDMMAADRGALSQLDSSIYSAQSNIVDAIKAGSGNSGGDGGNTGGTGDSDTDLLLNNIMPMLGNMTGILSSIEAYSGISANGANTFLGLDGMLGALIPAQSKSLSDINTNLADIKDLLANGSGGGEGGSGNSDTATENGCETFTCTSNSPVCYIARKAWEESCKSKQATESQTGNVDSVISALKEFNNSDDSKISNIEAGTADLSNILNHYNDSNGFHVSGASDTCPAPIPINTRLFSISLDMTPFCDLAGVISWFVVAFASVAAVLMFAKFS